MQIFIDTANIEQIEQAAQLGIISGVTTNPSLLSKEATGDYETVTKKICSIIDGPVSVEVLSEHADAMIEEARLKASWAPNVNIKIPITADGLRATSVLSQENIDVNMALCFSANQALLGALAGAAYVSIFIGRLDDAGHDGMQVVERARVLSPGIKVIVMTESPTLESAVQAANLGVNGYVPASVQNNELLSRVHLALGEHATSQKLGSQDAPRLSKQPVQG